MPDALSSRPVAPPLSPSAVCAEPASSGRRVSRLRALLVSLVVLAAGAAVGAGGYGLEQTRVTWRPQVSRTSDGWRISTWLGFAKESNGVMDYFFRSGTVQSTVFKVGIVTAGTLLLWRLRRYRAALFAAVLLTGIFAAVVVYQALWVLSF